jgi:DNA polymerase-3 subunit beta
MKIEILKENLKMALNVVERIVGKNLSLPILDNVLIDTDENYLVLSSTDLETAIKLWVLTKIVRKGKVAIPVKFLSSFVSLLPNEKIILEEKKQGLYVECKNLKTQIQGFNPEEFPIIPEFKNLEFIDLDIKKVCQGLSQVVDIASVSQSRPEISGIYFLFSKNNLKIVATDSFRLAEKTIVLDKAVKKEISFIIPQKPAKEIMNILIEKDGNTKIYFTPNQIMFEVQMKELEKPQIQITSRLIEGEYPNYQDIIPKEFKTKIVLKRDEFLNQIKTASLFSGKINEVKIIVNSKNNEVEVFAQSSDIGENRSSLSAKIQGEDLEVSFNHKYLIDGLNNIKSSEVIFELSEKEGPCVLKPVGDVNYLYVVMPIKST